jgi:uncharacterized protein involved in response to NO
MKRALGGMTPAVPGNRAGARMAGLAYGLIALVAVLRRPASSSAGEVAYPLMLATGALSIAGVTLYVPCLWPALVGPSADRQGRCDSTGPALSRHADNS